MMRWRSVRSATAPPIVATSRNRRLACERRDAEHRRRSGQPVDEPRLSHRLHPGADERDELAAEEELVVAMTERAEQLRHVTYVVSGFSRTLVDRARSRPARIAARTARAAGRGERRGVAAPAVGTDGKHRQELLQVHALAGRAAGRLTSARQILELPAAAAALVFEEWHPTTLHGLQLVGSGFSRIRSA